MKKIVAMFGALMMISGVVFAGEAPLFATAEMSVNLTDKIVKVYYRSDKAGKVKVTIYCMTTGKEVFTEEIRKQSKFIRPYNLDGLPYGEYSIVLEDENGRAVEKISYTKKVVKVLSSIIQSKETKDVTVALFSNGNTDVVVRLLDAKGNLLQAEQYAINGQANKRFNLKNIEGAVKVEVLNGEDEIIQTRTVFEKVL